MPFLNFAFIESTTYHFITVTESVYFWTLTIQANSTLTSVIVQNHQIIKFIYCFLKH